MEEVGEATGFSICHAYEAKVRTGPGLLDTTAGPNVPLIAHAASTLDGHDYGVEEREGKRRKRMRRKKPDARTHVPNARFT